MARQKETNVIVNKFINLAKEVCNGCDLVTGEENKLTTADVIAHDSLTVSDFALCEIDGKEVGVVTFVEEPEKYYWGGQSLTNMVVRLCTACGSEMDARTEYAEESEKIRIKFEATQTKTNRSFTKATVIN